MPEKKDRNSLLLRHGYGLDAVYALVLLSALCISAGAHVGMGKLPVPGFLFGSDLTEADEATLTKDGRVSLERISCGCEPCVGFASASLRLALSS